MAVGDRLKTLIVEVRELVDNVQAAIEQRPLLQAAIAALRAKVEEIVKEAEAEAPPPA